MSSGIYKITVNRFDGKPKFYVGQSSDIEARLRGHLDDLQKNRHHNRHLQFAYLKHGEAAFLFETVLVCSKDRDVLHMYEQSVVDFYGRDVLYNINTKCVKSPLGMRHSEEVKKAIGLAWKGKKRSPETIEKMRAAKLGKKRPAWVVEKVRAANISRKHSQEEIERRRASLIGKCKHTEEEKLRISARMAGTVNGRGSRSPEAKEKIRIGALAREAKRRELRARV